MSTTLVPLKEYLNTGYSPDREYVEGELVERRLGKRPHSRVQRNFVYFLSHRHPDLYVWPEMRVRSGAHRFRVPDVCVTLSDCEAEILEELPFLCIEILSPDDEMTLVLEKLEEYAAWGVPHIRLADPWRRKAFTYGNRCLAEVTGPALIAGDISLPLEEVFAGL